MKCAALAIAAALESALFGGPALAAPEFTLRTSLARASDSDAVHQQRVGAEIMHASAHDLGIGALLEHVRLGEPGGWSRADAAAVRARIRAGTPLQIEAHAGFVRLRSSGAETASVTRPQAGLRVRWRTSSKAPVVGELRLTRAPMLTSPTLARQSVDMSDHRLTLTAPLIGDVRARTRIQHAEQHELRQTNRRDGLELAAVLQAAPATEIALSHGILTYRRPALSAYTAFRRAETTELSVYGEWEFAGRYSLVLDAGIGRQQVRRFSEPSRDWVNVLRLVGGVTAQIHPDVRLELNVEHNDSPLGGRGDSPPSQWRSRALNVGVQVDLGS